MSRVVKLYSHRGNLNFTQSQLDVTDPCYDKDVWCRISVPIEPGAYRYEAVLVRYGDWGKRVSQLKIVKKGSGKVIIGKVVGFIGVDSGTAGFFEDKPNYTGEENEALYEYETRDGDDHYPWIIEGHKDNPVKCEGIYTSSGIGDGEYTVYELLDKNNKRVGYRIRFL